MKWYDVKDSLLGILPFTLGVAAMAGIVHISSTLAMPKLATKDAFARVQSVVPPFKTTFADPAIRALFPFEDPATAMSLCRYDLRQGPLRLTATLQPDTLMLFTFMARDGRTYYSMTDRGASRGNLDVLVLTQDQLDALEATEKDDQSAAELRVNAPSLDGFVAIRTLAEQPGLAGAARQRVLAISCGLDLKK